MCEKGNFNTVKQYILNHISLEEKTVSMNVLQEIYDIGMMEKRYRGKLKKRIDERFPDQLIFVIAKENNSEVVISNQVFQDTIHHSVNKNTTVEKAAYLIREDIRNQCTVNQDETSWPPNLGELQDLPVPNSVKLFSQTLLATVKHGSATCEKSTRLIDSFSADLISSVTNGSILTAKHYLLAVGLHSITGMRQIIQIFHKMGHCMSYAKTCDVESAMTENILARAKLSNISPLLPIVHEAVNILLG